MEMVARSIALLSMLLFGASSGYSSSYYEPVIVESSASMLPNWPKINNTGTILYLLRDNDGCSIFKMNEKGKVRVIPLASCESSTNHFDLNDSNEVIFTNFINSNYDIYYHSRETIVVGNDPDDEQYPQLNSLGQAAWWSYPQSQGTTQDEVYFYEDGTVKRINPSGFSHARNVRINNSGQVVWHAHPEGSVRPEILLFSNGVVKNVTNTAMVAEWNPEINDHGQIVWHANGGIHLYANGILKNIAESFGCGSGWGQKINNAGEVAWIANHCDKQFDYKVLLYQNDTVKDIGGTIPDDYDVTNLSLNNNGQVVWQLRKRGESQVFLYSDGDTRTIGRPDAFNDSPQINDLGQIIFRSWFPENTFHYMLASPTSLDYPDYFAPSPAPPPAPAPDKPSLNSRLALLKLLLKKFEGSPQQ